VVVAFIDNRDVDRLVAEAARCVQAAEPASNDHDAWHLDLV
jgi:hypothetical protein